MTISFTTAVYASPLEDLPPTRSLPSTAEKIAATYGAGIGGQIQFLPYLETPTRDTPEIRIALRSMLKDPYVKAAWLTQCFSVASSDFQVHPHDDDDPDAVLQAEFIEYGIERLHLGFAGMALSVLMPLGPDGISIVEPVTEIEGMGRWAGKWVPSAVKSKDLENLYILGDRYRNIESIRSLRTPEMGMISASEFLIARYAPMFDEAFGWAAFRSSYQSWWMLDTVRKLRAIHHEKRTGGTVVGQYTDPAQRPTVEDTLRKLKSSTWACIPEGVTLELLDLTKASDTDYAKFEEDKIRDIVVGITFAELQMLTSPNERGDTKVHQNQSRLGIWYLTKVLEETVNRQWIPRYIDWNFADPQGYPRITIGGPDDEETGRLVDLIQKAQAAGFDDLDKDYYAKALGLQRTQDPMKMLKPGGQGGMGQPGMMPGGDPNAPPDTEQDQYTTDDLGLGGDDESGFSDEGQQFAETTWVAFQGKRGGHGWRNTQTGEIKYQQENPGGDSQPAQPAEQSTGQHGPSDAPQQQPAQGEHAPGEQGAKPDGEHGPSPDGQPTTTPKPGVLGKVRSYANKVLDTKIGRLAQAAEHKLSIAAHKTRAIAVKAAEHRGATPEETARLAKTLAIADFVGGYVSGAAAGAVAGPVGAKVAMFMPSVSAAYLAYSAAKDPRATWKAALDVVASSSIDPRHLLREGKAAWSGGSHHAEQGTPAWVDQLAALCTGDPEQAEFRAAVFLAALVASGDPDQALQLATNPPRPKPTTAVRQFAEGANFTGTIKDSLGRERHYVDGKQVAGHHDEPAPQQHYHNPDLPNPNEHHPYDPEEHAEHHKRWDAENAQVENRRAAHDTANDAKGESTRKEREATRAKEDKELVDRETALKTKRAELPAKRRAEDKDRKAARVVEDRERVKTRKDRDKALEKQRDKKDADDLKRWEKEDKERLKKREKEGADIEKARAKEDKEIEAARAKRDKELPIKRAKEDAELKAKRKAEDKAAGRPDLSDPKAVDKFRKEQDFKIGKDRDAEDAAIEKRREAELEKLEADDPNFDWKTLVPRDEAEDKALQANRDKEDADLEAAREAEDKLIENREAEDEAIAERRDQEDSDIPEQDEAEDNAVMERREAEDEKLINDRDQEDERIENERSELSDADNDAREQEDSDNVDKDEQEDSDIEERREQEDSGIDEAREREDNDLEAARSDEDDALDAEEQDIDNTREDYETTRQEEDDALDSEEVAAYDTERKRRDAEDAQHYHRRRQEHPEAHASYYDRQHHHYQRG